MACGLVCMTMGDDRFVASGLQGKVGFYGTGAGRSPISTTRKDDMRYRVKCTGLRKFVAQYKYLWWPFWFSNKEFFYMCDVTVVFPTLQEAENWVQNDKETREKTKKLKKQFPKYY